MVSTIGQVDTMSESLLREPRRSYTAEFKSALVAEARQKNASVAEIARRHRLNHNLIFKWRREADARMVATPRMLSVQVLPDIAAPSVAPRPTELAAVSPLRVIFTDGASLVIEHAPEAGKRHVEAACSVPLRSSSRVRRSPRRCTAASRRRCTGPCRGGRGALRGIHRLCG